MRNPRHRHDTETYEQMNYNLKRTSKARLEKPTSLECFRGTQNRELYQDRNQTLDSLENIITELAKLGDEKGLKTVLLPYLNLKTLKAISDPSFLEKYIKDLINLWKMDNGI